MGAHNAELHNRIVGLEQAALDALPALKTQFFDGWILRRANGYSRRANSVAPLFASKRPLDEKLAHCEAAYAAVCQPCVFKITAASQPLDLEEQLAQRGYKRQAETLVQVLSLDGALAKPASIELYESPEGPFLQAWQELAPRTAQVDILAQLLRMIPVPAVYAVAYDAGKAVAYARAALSANQLGLFDLNVAPDYRQRGLATALVEARLWWGRNRGAREAYLQVMADNRAARQLQAKFAFTTLYKYWYRTRP